jgi:hypothetical protein
MTALEGRNPAMLETAYWVCQDLVNMENKQALMRMQAINLRLVTGHEVAGSEAEKSASSGG